MRVLVDLEDYRLNRWVAGRIVSSRLTAVEGRVTIRLEHLKGVLVHIGRCWIEGCGRTFDSSGHGGEVGLL